MSCATGEIFENLRMDPKESPPSDLELWVVGREVSYFNLVLILTMYVIKLGDPKFLSDLFLQSRFWPPSAATTFLI